MAPGKLSANENRLKHGAGVRGKPFPPNLFLGPNQNTSAKPAGLNETLHEVDLIDAGGQEVGREFHQGRFAQMAPSVEIVAAGLVAGSQVRLIRALATSQASCHRPDATGVQCFPQNGMGHQSRDPAVAIQKRVDPQ